MDISKIISELNHLERENMWATRAIITPHPDDDDKMRKYIHESNDALGAMIQRRRDRMNGIAFAAQALGAGVGRDPLTGEWSAICS